MVKAKHTDLDFLYYCSKCGVVYSAFVEKEAIERAEECCTVRK